MNDPTDIRMNTGAASPSTRSPVPCAIRTPSTASEARSTAAAQGRSRAGQTDHSSVPGAAGAAGAMTRSSRAVTLGLEVPPRQRELPRRSCLIQPPHRGLGRSLFHPLRVLSRLAIDREEHFGEGIETRLGLRLA